MKYVTILILTTIMFGCMTTNKNLDSKIIQNKWELNLLDGKQITFSQPIYIELTTDKKVTGFIGCNNLTGEYSIENGSQLKFSKLGTTRMACPEAETELERKVLEVLNKTDNFSIINGKLNLNAGSRAPLATFVEMNDNQIVNKYWKLKTLEGKNIEMAKNQAKAQYFILKSDGTITGFAGCNHFSGTFKLEDGNRIHFNENMAVTMKICPDVNVNENEFLKVFNLTDNYTINGNTLNLNVGRRAPLAIFEAVEF